MSSREIAELTGKQHKDVLYDTRKMLEELGIQSADFSADYKDARGRTQQELCLPKDRTLTLVTGYDVKRRHAINKRWLEVGRSAFGSAYREAPVFIVALLPAMIFVPSEQRRRKVAF